jgi:hypothetical protein
MRLHSWTCYLSLHPDLRLCQKWAKLHDVNQRHLHVILPPNTTCLWDDQFAICTLHYVLSVLLSNVQRFLLTTFRNFVSALPFRNGKLPSFQPDNHSSQRIHYSLKNWIRLAVWTQALVVGLSSGPGFEIRPVQSNLWWTKQHWERRTSEFFCFPH